LAHLGQRDFRIGFAEIRIKSLQGL